MSTLKTVLSSAAIILLVLVLSGLSGSLYLQHQDIQTLQVQVATEQQTSARYQTQLTVVSARLSKMIHIANENFSTIQDRQDKIVQVLKDLIPEPASASSSYTTAKGE